MSGQDVAPLFCPQRYFTLYVAAALIFGVGVHVPARGGLPRDLRRGAEPQWRKWRRPAIVVIALVAAVVTPSNDPFSFLAMAVPMLIFYEVSIIIGRILKK